MLFRSTPEATSTPIPEASVTPIPEATATPTPEATVTSIPASKDTITPKPTETAPRTKAVKTGDNTPIVLYVVLLGAAVIVLAVVIWKRYSGKGKK